MKPEEEEEEIAPESSLTDFFGSVARDVTSQILEKLDIFQEIKHLDEEEDDEEEDDTCALTEAPITFSQKEVDFINQQSTEKQPPAF